MSFEITTTRNKVVSVSGKISLNIKEKAFCDLYVSMDKEVFGNATLCYMKAYGVKNYQSANANAIRLIGQQKITEYINTLLSEQGFNDQNVDKQHLFIINQHKDLNVKMKGIEHYNRLKKRIDNKLELIMPTPLLGWDDDVDTIRKIDKSKAVDIQSGTENNITI